MKIKVTSILHNVYGDPLKGQRDKPKVKDKPLEKEDLTLKDIMVNALLAEFPDEQKTLSGADKLKRYRLAMDIMDAKIEIDLCAEDMVLIKDMIAKAYNSLVSGQAWEMLEPKN